MRPGAISPVLLAQPGRSSPAELVAALRRETALVQQPVEAIEGRRLRIGGRWVVSFVSPSYLGLEQDPRVQRAACHALCSWGVYLSIPRLLARDRLSAQLEAAIARFTGQPAALVFPSTTHAALDLLPFLSRPSGMIFVDAWTYPTNLEGVQAARRRGTRVYQFPHNDALALESAMRAAPQSYPKVIVCDGIYPEGGQASPLEQFAALTEALRGLLYVDDSHGIGVLGEGLGVAGCPYGRRGGGLARSLGVEPGRIVLAGTLSKALGVPVSFVAGPTSLLRRVESTAGAFVHSSPPSLPNVAAALEALRMNEREGDRRRRLLASLVLRFQQGLLSENIGVSSHGMFPIQTIPFPSSARAQAAGKFLRRAGIWPALQFHPPDYPGGSVLRFFLTALHTEADVDHVVDALASFQGGRPSPLGEQYIMPRPTRNAQREI